MNPAIFQPRQLDAAHVIWISRAQPSLARSGEGFQELWNAHPDIFHKVKFMGKEVDTPRWQQAYGKNYRYTGSQNNALPIPEILQPYLDWAQQEVDSRLNGLLLNWYEGKRGHYIGAHRDDTRDLVPGSPVVTISVGEQRTFRLRPWKQKGMKDFPFGNGQVIVVPWETNEAWTHEVPHFAENIGRRISVTLRAYSE